MPHAGNSRSSARGENNLGIVILSSLIAILSVSSLYLSLATSQAPLNFRFPSEMPSPSAILRSFLQTRTLILALVVLNLKSLPLSWHLRLLYHFLRNIRRQKPSLAPIITSSDRTSSSSLPSSIAPPHTREKHPLFAYSVLRTHAPLLEIDYNLHKSNATYFLDLDASRTQHVTRLVSPAFPGLADTLRKQEGYVGRLGFILGSVHTSFRREIRLYEGYEVWTRVLSWDRKWLIMGSWFIRRKRGKGAGNGKEKDGTELEVLASALSKYVLKIGRRTVEVERCLREAGWLPERPPEEEEQQKEQEESTIFVSEKGDHSSSGDEAGGAVTPGESGADIVPAPRGHAAEAPSTSHKQWTWHDVEAERARGMEIAELWLKLDTDLFEEFEAF